PISLLRPVDCCDWRRDTRAKPRQGSLLDERPSLHATITDSRPPDIVVSVCHAKARRCWGKRNWSKYLGPSASEKFVNTIFGRFRGSLPGFRPDSIVRPSAGPRECITMPSFHVRRSGVTDAVCEKSHREDS